MTTHRASTPEVVFPLRRDRAGWRAVYKLGNERGRCPFQCKFCGVGNSPRVTSAENMALFDALHARHLATLDGPYHAAIFNRGNVTDRGAFSQATLDHVLETFVRDPRVTCLSLNSREVTATADVLDELAARQLPCPLHFIFGQESFTRNAQLILGKNNQGELERFIEKLQPYNTACPPTPERKKHVFGLDVNLVFLPELYLDLGESRHGHEEKIAAGFAAEVRQLLALAHPLVPIHINLHPFYPVASLPYEPADLFMLVRMLPVLQQLVDTHNRRSKANPTQLFVGVVFATQPDTATAPRLVRLQALLDEFNRTGRLPAA